MDLSFSEEEESFRQRLAAFIRLTARGLGTMWNRQAAGDDVTALAR